MNVKKGSIFTMCILFLFFLSHYHCIDYIKKEILDITFEHVIIDSQGPQDPHTKSAGDINGDGFIDVLVASSSGGPLIWYEYPDWSKHEIASTGRWSTDAEVGDLDGDGDQDIVISEWYTKNQIEWYENPGPTGDPAKDLWILHVVGSPRAHDIELADFDRDGDLDIVARLQSYWGDEGNKLYFWRQNNPPSWSQKVVDCPHGEGLTVGDIDIDGDPDVIIAGRWYELDGDIVNGSWMEHIFSSNFDYPHCMVKMGDVNGDGRPDVVVTPSEPEGVFYRTSWFSAPLNPFSENWTEHVIDDQVEVTHSLGVADMDNDGDFDVVTAEMHKSSNPDEVRIYINRGDGSSWSKQVVATTGSHNLRVVDIGSDGDADLVGANYKGSYQSVEMWENLSEDFK